MHDDLLTLSDRISLLIDARESSSAALLAEMEHTLTDGYARALELEGERWRLEKQIGALTARIADADEVDDLRDLVTRLGDADRELGRLRGLLAALRRRVDTVRAATAAAAASG